jgi:hypothetical protein
MYMHSAALTYCIPVLPTSMSRWIELIHEDDKPFGGMTGQLILNSVFSLSGVIDVIAFRFVRQDVLLFDTPLPPNGHDIHRVPFHNQHVPAQPAIPLVPLHNQVNNAQPAIPDVQPAIPNIQPAIPDIQPAIPDIQPNEVVSPFSMHGEYSTNF